MLYALYTTDSSKPRVLSEPATCASMLASRGATSSTPAASAAIAAARSRVHRLPFGAARIAAIASGAPNRTPYTTVCAPSPDTPLATANAHATSSVRVARPALTASIAASVATNGSRPSNRFSCPTPSRQPTTGANAASHTVATRAGPPSRTRSPHSDSATTIAKYASRIWIVHVTTFSVVSTPSAETRTQLDDRHRAAERLHLAAAEHAEAIEVARPVAARHERLAHT